jgi:hypothetical protein
MSKLVLGISFTVIIYSVAVQFGCFHHVFFKTCLGTGTHFHASVVSAAIVYIGIRKC